MKRVISRSIVTAVLAVSLSVMSVGASMNAADASTLGSADDLDRHGRFVDHGGGHSSVGSSTGRIDGDEGGLR